MSWGTELWDQYDSIAAHTQKGIDFLEKYGHFVDQRSKIEQEYASKLRRLIKTYLPKKKEEDDYQFTCLQAYKNLLNELGDQAGQHEMIAENLSTSVVQELSSLTKQLKDDRRKHLNEGARIQSQLQSSLMLLTKTKEKYEKAFGASERALDAYQKADADLNLSRAEVEKQRMNSTIKSQQYDDCKNEYANQLQKTNELQSKYYSQTQPAVYHSLQDVDEKRIKCFKNFILKAVSAEKEVLPIVSQCLDGVVSSAESIDEREDSRIVIEKFKSGFSAPGDIPFEDLSSADNASVNGSMSSMPQSINHPVMEKKTSIIGTITGGRIRKRSGLLGLFSNSKAISSPYGGNNKQDDFSELPPNQRKKKLQSKIEEITGKICQETAARDGLMKMKQVYESNPALGDPMSIQGQLTENGHRLDKLRSELKKFQDFLDELEGKAPNSPAIRTKGESSTDGPTGNGNRGGGGGSLKKKRSSRRRSSMSDGAESLSRSGSDSSVSQHRKDSKNSDDGGGGGGGAGGQHGNEPIRKVTCRILSPLAKKPPGGNEETAKPTTPSSSRSPESGICTSSMSLPSSSSGSNDKSGRDVGLEDDQDVDDDEEEFFEAETLPIIGRCQSLYPFEVTSEGSIRMEENEELWVIESDQGDGWTRVRRIKPSTIDPMPEGFVPTSYIETTELFAVPHHPV